MLKGANQKVGRPSNRRIVLKAGGPAERFIGVGMAMPEPFDIESCG